MHIKIILALFTTLTLVYSHDVIVGQNTEGRKIFDEHKQTGPAIWRQVENVTINATDNEVISRIVVTDLRPEKDGDAKIVEGGEGQKNVTLELKSPTALRGYEFHIEVYAVPDKNQPAANKDTKNQDPNHPSQTRIQRNPEDVPNSGEPSFGQPQINFDDITTETSASTNKDDPIPPLVSQDAKKRLTRDTESKFGQPRNVDGTTKATESSTRKNIRIPAIVTADSKASDSSRQSRDTEKTEKDITLEAINNRKPTANPPAALGNTQTTKEQVRNSRDTEVTSEQPRLNFDGTTKLPVYSTRKSVYVPISTSVDSKLSPNSRQTRDTQNAEDNITPKSFNSRNTTVIPPVAFRNSQATTTKEQIRNSRDTEASLPRTNFDGPIKLPDYSTRKDLHAPIATSVDSKLNTNLRQTRDTQDAEDNITPKSINNSNPTVIPPVAFRNTQATTTKEQIRSSRDTEISSDQPRKNFDGTTRLPEYSTRKNPHAPIATSVDSKLNANLRQSRDTQDAEDNITPKAINNSNPTVIPPISFGNTQATTTKERIRNSRETETSSEQPRTNFDSTKTPEYTTRKNIHAPVLTSVDSKLNDNSRQSRDTETAGITTVTSRTTNSRPKYNPPSVVRSTPVIKSQEETRKTRDTETKSETEINPGIIPTGLFNRNNNSTDTPVITGKDLKVNPAHPRYARSIPDEETTDGDINKPRNTDSGNPSFVPLNVGRSTENATNVPFPIARSRSARDPQHQDHSTTARVTINNNERNVPPNLGNDTYTPVKIYERPARDTQNEDESSSDNVHTHRTHIDNSQYPTFASRNIGSNIQNDSTDAPRNTRDTVTESKNADSIIPRQVARNIENATNYRANGNGRETRDTEGEGKTDENTNVPRGLFDNNGQRRTLLNNANRNAENATNYDQFNRNSRDTPRKDAITQKDDEVTTPTYRGTHPTKTVGNA